MSTRFTGRILAHLAHQGYRPSRSTRSPIRCGSARRIDRTSTPRSIIFRTSTGSSSVRTTDCVSPRTRTRWRAGSRSRRRATPSSARTFRDERAISSFPRRPLDALTGDRVRCRVLRRSAGHRGQGRGARRTRARRHRTGGRRARTGPNDLRGRDRPARQALPDRTGRGRTKTPVVVRDPTRRTPVPATRCCSNW